MKEMSDREKLYFNIMKSGNVLYIEGRPGDGKSAIGRAIADKMNYNYISLSLGQLSEVDMGQFPFLEKLQNGVTQVNFASPKWATEANEKPTIIHFEELNRCRQEMMDASLLILNDKMVGDLKLNENVLMMSSGNIGDSDGTSVNEFDNALINRLFKYNHSLLFTEWKEQFGIENVNQTIISFLNVKPEHFYKFPKENGQPYATPRSWTNLSKYLDMFTELSNRDILLHIQKVGHGFIGSSAVSFMRWLEDSIQLSINDILTNYKQLTTNVLELGRHRISELLISLKEIDLESLEKLNIDNIILFISDLNKTKENQDEVTGYLLDILENQIEVDFQNCDNAIAVITHFKTLINEIQENMEKI